MVYVLTVAKNLIVSDKIGIIARSHGFDVITRTGSDAIAKAKLQQPALIVVDLQEGTDFLKELKANGITSLVVGFYPHVKTEIKKQAQNLGFPNIFPNSMMENALADFLGRLSH